MDNNEELKKKWTKIQENYIQKLDLDPEIEIDNLHYIGGVDISFFKSDETKAVAALVVLDINNLKKPVYSEYQLVTLEFPYISTFLAFREVPSFLQLFKNLQEKKPDLMPDITLVDGCGILHPRKMGSATHLSLALAEELNIVMPTIGVAKELLYVDGLERDSVKKKYYEELEKGEFKSALIGKSSTTYGYAVRSTNKSKNPIYVSPGNLISCESAVNICRHVSMYRIPEPIRVADLGSRDVVRNILQKEKKEKEQKEKEEKEKEQEKEQEKEKEQEQEKEKEKEEKEEEKEKEKEKEK
ncbi:endonuclease v [Anaeramoeba flamelloides]|uniref:Endonuclease v n=1 Tax=Anaeramoeba flamelloides TaxID=1746091 RepID=A0ABQ8ZDR0_9EUKA|nr:endonuclease v [Anaeramoeba flamelloides]